MAVSAPVMMSVPVAWLPPKDAGTSELGLLEYFRIGEEGSSENPTSAESAETAMLNWGATDAQGDHRVL